MGKQWQNLKPLLPHGLIEELKSFETLGVLLQDGTRLGITEFFPSPQLQNGSVWVKLELADEPRAENGKYTYSPNGWGEHLTASRNFSTWLVNVKKIVAVYPIKGSNHE